MEVLMLRVTRPVMLAVLTCALGAACRSEQSVAPAAVAVKELPVFPADANGFVAQIDNPYLAFAVGRVFHYQSQTADGLETDVVEVTSQPKHILGITATVVHDQVFLDGALTEDTFDWYAQDTLGNVWYLGEDSKQIQNGVVVGIEGSWETGVNGAHAGIIMLAHPKVGLQYQQEFAAGVAEDMAKVVNLSATAQVPFTSCTDCLKTEEWTALEPGARESKFYKPGVGLVLELQPSGGGIRNELTAIEN
jgi:hypothetical protein